MEAVFVFCMIAVFGLGYMIGSIATGNSWYKHCFDWAISTHKKLNSCISIASDTVMIDALKVIMQDIDELIQEKR